MTEERLLAMHRNTHRLCDLEPQRVCLVKPSALGDVVQTLPVLSALAARWPQAQFTWVVNRSLAGLLRGHPQLDEVIEFDREARGLRQVQAAAALWNTLRTREFDLTIDLQGLLRSGLMTLATGAPRRVGLSDAREGATLAYTDVIPIQSRELPALERYWQLVSAIGGMRDAPAARLGTTDAHRDWVQARLASLPRPWLAIHPGAQWETKRWPPEQFAALARRAQQEFGAGVVIVGGPGEREPCQQIAAELAGPFVELAGQTDLLQLAAVSASADVFLSGDTGPMHLAAAMGTPVVSLFTCTSPVRAGPRYNDERVVATHVSCAASYIRTCSSLACMRELTAWRVWPTLRDTLAQTAITHVA